MKFTLNTEKILIVSLLIFIAVIYWVTRQRVLSYDEYRDLYLAKMIMNGQYSYFGDAFYLHPPLYMSLLAFSSMIFGYGEDAGYIVSIMFAIGTILITYLFAFRIFNKKVAFAAAIILAFNPFFSHFARDMRFEVATTFFMLSSVYMFWRYFDTRKISLLISTGVVVGLGLLVKSFLFFVYPIILLYILILWRQKKCSFINGIKIISIIGLISLLTYSPWLIYTTINGGPNQAQAQLEQFTGKVSWDPNYKPPPFYYYFLGLPSLLTWQVLIFSLVGIFYSFKNIKDRTLIPIIWLVVFILLISIMGYKETRFMTYVVPGFVLFAVAGIYFLLNKIKITNSAIFIILVIAVSTTGLIYAEFPLWKVGETLKTWDMWDYIANNVGRNEYIPTNNYGMVELYSNPSDFLMNDWSVDSFRFLSLDSKYALVESKIQYPKQHTDIFSEIKSFQFVGYYSTINLTLYGVDLYKLSTTILGNNSIAVNGIVKNIVTNEPIQRAKVFIADYNSKQIINVFYTKLDGSFTAYLPSSGVYIIQSNAFGFGTTNYVAKIEPNLVIMCENQNNCITKNIIEIGLQFQGYLTHGYPSSRY